jgi:hypothetical protein
MTVYIRIDSSFDARYAMCDAAKIWAYTRWSDVESLCGVPLNRLQLVLNSPRIMNIVLQW